jgi:hypothetical protein
MCYPRHSFTSTGDKDCRVIAAALILLNPQGQTPPPATCRCAALHHAVALHPLSYTCYICTCCQHMMHFKCRVCSSVVSAVLCIRLSSARATCTCLWHAHFLISISPSVQSSTFFTLVCTSSELSCTPKLFAVLYSGSSCRKSPKNQDDEPECVSGVCLDKFKQAAAAAVVHHMHM